MKRCTECTMPDTRPDTQFVDGVCSACISYKNRPTIDWGARKQELARLLDAHHGRCIVPSSGGKDSTWQALTLLEMGADVNLLDQEKFCSPLIMAIILQVRPVSSFYSFFCCSPTSP